MKNSRLFIVMGIFVTILALFLAGCSNSTDDGGSSDPSTYRFFGGAFYDTEDEKTYVVGDVLADGYSTGNATVTVNDRQLYYGIPIEYNGQTIDYLPVYYGEAPVTYGQPLDLKASVGTYEFFTGSATVPGNISITQPLCDTVFYGSDDINMAWDSVNFADIYNAFYEGLGDIDAYYSTPSTGTTAVIPNTETVAGAGAVGVEAYNGDYVDELFSGDSPDEETSDVNADEPLILDKSYWFAVNSAQTDITVQNVEPAGDVIFTSKDGRTTVPLSVLKADRVNIDGVTFTRRIYDANQITTGGSLSISMELKKHHLSIGCIELLNSGQNVYYSWKKVRAYKSSNKTYNHSIGVSPFSTLIILTKTADLKQANYNY